jgi:hypothetical protein
MKLRRTPRRIKTFLDRYGLGADVAAALTDPRKTQGKRPFTVLVDLFMTGALMTTPALRGVERLSERMGPRVPDSTLAYTLERIDPAPLRPLLRRRVKQLLRSKVLRPDGLPFGVLTIDGKTVWTGDHRADPECQDQDGVWHLRVMRAVLTSARSRPCLDQDVIPAATNEMGHFPTFWAALRAAYGRSDLFALVTLDAGYTSQDNARVIDADGYGYLLRVKDNQPTLRAEVERLLRPRAGQPEAVSRWEAAHGKQVQRRLVRTAAIAAWDGWPHLRQGWLVQTVVKHPDRREAVVEERFYVTNLPWNALTAAQMLRVVRDHWGIENDCNWVLDVVWREDTTAWATNAQALAGRWPLRTLMAFRMLAYNLLTWLLRVRLRGARGRKPTWDELRQSLAAVLLPLPTALDLELAFATLG